MSEVKKSKTKKKLKYKLFDIVFDEEKDIKDYDKVNIEVGGRTAITRASSFISEEELDLEELIAQKDYMKAKEYLEKHSSLIGFFDKRVNIYENLSLETLNQLSRCDCRGAIKQLEYKYKEENELELAMMYMTKLSKLEQDEKYIEIINEMLENGYNDKHCLDQTQLGLELYYGKIIERDEEKALEVLDFAAKNGSLLAREYAKLIETKRKRDVEISKKLEEKNNIIKYLREISKV